MRKFKRTAYLLTAVICLFTFSGPVKVRAEAVESETEISTEETAGRTGPLLSPEMIEKLEELIDGLKVDEIYDIASTAWGVGNSEEFKRLIEYPEMQALVKSVLKKGVRVASDDPEMVKEILITLGVEEKYVELLEKLVTAAKDLDPDMAQALLGSL